MTRINRTTAFGIIFAVILLQVVSAAPGNDRVKGPVSASATPGAYVDIHLKAEDKAALLGHLRAREFGALEKILNGYLDAYAADTRNEIQAADAFDTFQENEAALEPRLDEWVNAFPKSYAARLARGAFHVDVGWEKRGTGWARDTLRERFNEMERYFKLARRELESSLKLHPFPVLSYKYLINMAKHQGDDTEARAWLNSALKLDPYTSSVRRAYFFGLRPEWGGSFQSMEAFVEETRAFPAHPKLDFILRKLESGVLERHCRAEAEAKRYERALDYCNRALAQYRDSSDALVQRAHVLSYLNRHDEALTDVNRALELWPKYRWAQEQRVWLLRKLGRTAELTTDLVSASARGKAAEQAQLGRMYAMGEGGLARNPAEAFRLVTLSAQQNHPEGQLLLGIFYMEAQGVARNDAEALKWFHLAAAQGNLTAMNNVGYYLWHGLATPVDKPNAIRWWRRAAADGFTMSQQNLSRYPDRWDLWRVDIEDFWRQFIARKP